MRVFYAHAVDLFISFMLTANKIIEKKKGKNRQILHSATN